MPRAKQAKKRTVQPDPVYVNRLVTKLINKTMKDGKKSKAQKHVYKALEMIKETTKDDPINVLRQAIDNVKPTMEVRSRRVGGAAYQVPMPVRGDRRESLAIRWLVNAARTRSNSQYHHFYDKLSAELLDAAKSQGGAMDKKNQMNKMAEANKAFAHFRW
ncbi:30S ribosomal protein S7 [Patescibacteria group bacterium]